MRKLVLHMHVTANNRIAKANGEFWEPFPWGEEEMAYLNERIRSADTWAFGRVMFEAIVPWWDSVARGQVPEDVPAVTAADQEFAQLLSQLTKIVFSRTLPPADDRVVLNGDIAAELADLKLRDGKDIMLSCGAVTLAPLVNTPGLVDELLIAVHPAVITDGPQLFNGLSADLALRLLETKVFAGGCLLLRYEVAQPANT